MTFMVALGWLGTVTYLLNHAYISLVPQWRPSIYYGANLVAALALVATSLHSQSLQAVAINGFWALLSIALLYGLPVAKLPFSSRLFHQLLLVFAIAIGYLSSVNGAQAVIALGWSSVFVFSAAYLLFSSGKMKTRHYLAFNGYAALALMPQLWLDQNWPVFGLEVAWAAISFYGVGKHKDDVHLID
jgi:hypothetical protein